MYPRRDDPFAPGDTEWGYRLDGWALPASVIMRRNIGREIVAYLRGERPHAHKPKRVQPEFLYYTGCKTLKQLGDHFKSTMTPEMTMDNYKSYWQIGNVIPLNFFFPAFEDHALAGFHYTNFYASRRDRDENYMYMGPNTSKKIRLLEVLQTHPEWKTKIPQTFDPAQLWVEKGRPIEWAIRDKFGAIIGYKRPEPAQPIPEITEKV